MNRKELAVFCCCYCCFCKPFSTINYVSKNAENKNNYQLKIFAIMECINGIYDKTDWLWGLPYIHTTNNTDN